MKSALGRRGALDAIAGAALMVATLAVYAPAFRAGMLWDDGVYVFNNRLLRSLAGLVQIWTDPRSTAQYYPLTYTTFWLEYRLWRGNPLGYHVVNVLLHGANALLLLRLLRRLAVPGAGLASALFALHPVHTAAVMWIAERKAMLSAAFVLLSALAWSRYLQGERRRDYALALLCFAAAMLSKTSVVLLPLVLAAIACWKRPRAWRRPVLLLVPWLAAAIGLALVTAWRESFFPAGNEAATGWVERILFAVRVFWLYLAKLLWPHPLMTLYPRLEVRVSDPLAWIWVALALAVPAVLWRVRARTGPAPLVALAAFAFLLAPALGLFPFRFLTLSPIADHLQYVPSIGLIALAAAALERVTRPLGRARAGLAVALAASLGLLATRQAAVYRSSETQWRHNVRHNPGSFHAQLFFAGELEEKGETDRAVEHFTAAQKIDPRIPNPYLRIAAIYAKQGRVGEALRSVSAAAEVAPEDAVVQMNLGRLLAHSGRHREAVAHLRKAIRLQPDLAAARSTLAQLVAAHPELIEVEPAR